MIPHITIQLRSLGDGGGARNHFEFRNRGKKFRWETSYTVLQTLLRLKQKSLTRCMSQQNKKAQSLKLNISVKIIHFSDFYILLKETATYLIWLWLSNMPLLGGSEGHHQNTFPLLVLSIGKRILSVALQNLQQPGKLRIHLCQNRKIIYLLIIISGKSFLRHLQLTKSLIWFTLDENIPPHKTVLPEWETYFPDRKFHQRLASKCNLSTSMQLVMLTSHLDSSSMTKALPWTSWLWTYLN